MKNVRETKSLPFLALITPEDRAGISPEGDIPAPLKAAADSLGVEKATDNVDLSLSLGSVIFDIYHLQTELPKAPLALEREKAKRLALSAKLEKDKFEVPEDIKAILEKTLSDDTAWSKIVLSTHYKVGEETRMLQLNSIALDIFQDTKKALMSLFV